MMNDIQLDRLDLNLLVTFEALMTEGSVTGTAQRLNKTPSAISHALGRLRIQVGDPLMVKVGGRMQPTAFALSLVQEVRPILRSIQRVIAPPQPFDPATSTRTFRIAVPAVAALISEVFARIEANAPGVSLEWVGLGPHLYSAVADEQVDLALLNASSALPEGIIEQKMPILTRYTFLREGHPALADWGPSAWLSWPHVVVGVANAARETVQDAVAGKGLERRIGAHIPEFSGVAPILARTNMLGTTVPLFMAGQAEAHGLVAKRPPVEVPNISFRFFWSARLSEDPGIRWLRSIVIGAYETVSEAALQSDRLLD